MPTLTELWLPMPAELYQKVRETLAGRDDALVERGTQNPSQFGKELYAYWASRKHGYGLREVLALLEPTSLTEGAAVRAEADEIKHTLKVQSLIWKWLDWAEADFVIPGRFKEAFRERLPGAATRWEEAFDQGPDIFGHLIKGAAISIRDYREYADDLGYQRGDYQGQQDTLRKLDSLSNLWDELWREYYHLRKAASEVRYDLESNG